VEALESAAAQARISLADLAATVIAAPGSYDPSTDQLRYSDHLPDWQQTGLIAHLSERIPGTVAVENDVNLVAVAEQRERERTAENFVLLWLDERIGGAIFVDGKLFRGTRGAAGEAAFLQVPGVPAVRNPAQDNHGGFEDLAGEAVVRELAARVGINSASAPDAVAALVASDTQAAREVLTDIGGRYAIGLASILALLDPAEVILAGAVAAAGGQQLVDAVASELSAVAIATPPVTLGVVTDSPITRGAMILSLGHARDRVFNT
jgi:predicted NBD/HSP70 family sugar kinase